MSVIFPRLQALLLLCGAFAAFLLPLSARAAYIPSGVNQSLGNATHGASADSAFNNPAGGLSLGLAKQSVVLTAGAGLEYGNVDDIFAAIDAISAVLQGREDDEPPPESLPPLPGHLPHNPTFQDLIEAHPEFQAWLESVEEQAVFLAGSLAIISQEAYAKGFFAGDLGYLGQTTFAGGALSMSVHSSASSRARGIVDVFDYDSDHVIEQLQAAKELGPDDPKTTFELSDDLELIVDPKNNSLELNVTNESLLLTKSAIVNSIKVTYSREALRTQHGKLFWGIRPKIVQAGLSQLDVRFGELTDAEQLYEDIRHADFRRSSRLSMDIGALWQAEHYSVGVMLNDLNAPQFNFPSVDTQRYSKAEVVSELQQESAYNLLPQLKLEGAWTSPSKRWTLSSQLDANKTDDPLGDKYQWWVFGGQVQGRQSWSPSLRMGYRKNLAGSNLAYYNMGFSLFNVVSLDVSATSERVKLDGKHLNRGLNISLGFNVLF